MRGKESAVEDIQTFDSASRGPWGSASLLFSRHCCSFASAGALTTILALAFDPFIQQVLTHPSRAVASAGTASIATVRAFSLPADNGEWSDSISAGIWSQPEQFDQQPTCTTGNCKWPILNSVGWFSQCADATSYATIQNCDLEKLGSTYISNSTTCVLSFAHGNTLQLLQASKSKPQFDSNASNIGLIIGP